MTDKNFTAEQLEAAKMCKSPEELVAQAKEQGIDVTLEQAAAFMNPEAAKTEEISDEELDNVAGGGDPSEHVWAERAMKEGRHVKVKNNFERGDPCLICSALSSIYAASKKETMKYSSQKYQICLVTEYLDCKCYACWSEFKEMEEV